MYSEQEKLHDEFEGIWDIQWIGHLLKFHWLPELHGPLLLLEEQNDIVNLGETVVVQKEYLSMFPSCHSPQFTCILLKDLASVEELWEKEWPNQFFCGTLVLFQGDLLTPSFMGFWACKCLVPGNWFRGNDSCLLWSEVSFCSLTLTFNLIHLKFLWASHLLYFWEHDGYSAIP